MEVQTHLHQKDGKTVKRPEIGALKQTLGDRYGYYFLANNGWYSGCNVVGRYHLVGARVRNLDLAVHRFNRSVGCLQVLRLEVQPMIALAILWGGITALMAGLIWLTIYASTEIHDILKGE